MNTVLVTGSSSGIGLATARLLAERGFGVVGGSLAPGEGERALDVRDDAAVQAFVDQARAATGRIDAWCPMPPSA
jgi:NAD(P)-dependent dehydrogenase (short-subunit alcohol dehydrogenase family)